MKVKIDVFLGEKCYIDLSFLSKRRKWLPNTGIYIEFNLNGRYDVPINFDLISEDENCIQITRYSWNKFFLNVDDTSSILFRVKSEKNVFIETPFKFEVEKSDVPVVCTIPFLLQCSVADVRFFCNRLSERMVNGTRLTLFTPFVLEKLSEKDWELTEEDLKYFDVLFSIITERGLDLYVTFFDYRSFYTHELIHDLKKFIYLFMERFKKFNVVWDFSGGLPFKSLNIVAEGILSRYKDTNMRVVVPTSFSSKVTSGVVFKHILPFNPKIVESSSDGGAYDTILRINGRQLNDFYALRTTVREIVKHGYGVEYYMGHTRTMNDVRLSLAKAVVLGRDDAKEENRSDV